MFKNSTSCVIFLFLSIHTWVEFHIARPIMGRGVHSDVATIVATTVVYTLLPIIPVCVLIAGVGMGAAKAVLPSCVSSDTENSSLSLIKKD